MIITDLNGKAIHITNLDKALKQANDFRKYKHTEDIYQRLDKERKAYWEDMYKKLKQLERIREKITP